MRASTPSPHRHARDRTHAHPTLRYEEPHFPNDAAAVKLLWLAICNIEDKRARDRAKERGKPSSARRASGRLVEGAVTTNWKKALEQLALVYPDRIQPYL